MGWGDAQGNSPRHSLLQHAQDGGAGVLLSPLYTGENQEARVDFIFYFWRHVISSCVWMMTGTSVKRWVTRDRVWKIEMTLK